ncbi:MAG: hypothetical protein GVY26_20950 [Bacteroidetes bacterium]|jgi:hypothetical protein|nr:hypothetical protein [Bacteroidota bacterium]
MKLYITIGLLLAAFIGTAQTSKLHVITKRLEKSFPYRDKYELNIEGEKADVLIETWDKPEIAVELELIARHPDRATAEADVEKIRYIAKRIKNKIYLRNYISIKEGEEKPVSNLQARYTVRVPENCPVYLKNYFGVANVTNLNNRFRFRGEFSNIGMENLRGEIDLDTRFGEIQAKAVDGQVAMDTRRTDITLEQIAGNYNIQTLYGKLRILSISEGLLDLNINAEKSEVFLFDSQLLEYGYSLTAQHGQIYFPSDLKLEFLKNTEEVKKVTFQPQREYYPNITISVSFGDMHLRKEKPTSGQY